MTGAIRILVIEDDADTRANLRDILELDGYQVTLASRIRDVLDRSDWSEYTAIILDRRLPDGATEELLPKLVKLAPSAGIVVVTGHADFEGAVTAMRLGVADYLLKPIDPEALLASVNRIVRVRQADERAQEAACLAAIGDMMAVLVHESRNKFQLASVSLDMLAWKLEGQTEELELIERVHKHQGSVSQLFEDVRSYAAPIQLDRTFVDITAVLLDAADEVRAMNSSRGVRIDISGQDESGLPLRASIDERRIEQVFRNLLENSVAACPDRVEIHIACAIAETRGEPVIELHYRDNGPGLSADCRRHIFEPFYTTKTKGTGLGMAITRRIVEAHGGTIEVIVSQDDSGAEFLISLPVRNNSDSNPPSCSNHLASSKLNPSSEINIDRCAYSTHATG